MTGQSNSSQGRGHDRLPNWNPKHGGMLISQPVTVCSTNHSELCMSCLLNNQPRRISAYRLQRRPSLGFESSVSSTLMTSDNPVVWVNALVLTAELTIKQGHHPSTASSDRQCHVSDRGLRQRQAAAVQSLIGLPLTSSFLLEYSSEYLNEYSSTR